MARLTQNYTASNMFDTAPLYDIVRSARSHGNHFELDWQTTIVIASFNLPTEYNTRYCGSNKQGANKYCYRLVQPLKEGACIDLSARLEAVQAPLKDPGMLGMD